MSRLGGEEEVKADVGAFGAFGGAIELCVGLIPLKHKTQTTALTLVVWSNRMQNTKPSLIPH